MNHQTKSQFSIESLLTGKIVDSIHFTHILKEKLHAESKKKRSRTIFSSEQLKSLEQQFIKQQYIVGEERKVLAKCLKLTETQVSLINDAKLYCQDITYFSRLKFGFKTVV